MDEEVRVVDGIAFDLTSDEVKGLIEKQIGSLESGQSRDRERVDAFSASKRPQAAEQVKNAKRKIAERQQAIDFWKFMKDHVAPGLTFRVTTPELHSLWRIPEETHHADAPMIDTQ